MGNSESRSEGEDSFEQEYSMMDQDYYRDDLMWCSEDPEMVCYPPYAYEEWYDYQERTQKVSNLVSGLATVRFT